jgi:hypothetical protein
MALLGFKDRFVSLIESGEKRHTIRGHRADIEAGTRLDLYARPRQKGMRLIFRAPCTKVEQIEIRDFAAGVDAGIRIDGIELSGDERELLAKADGFTQSKVNEHFVSTAWLDMLMFWEGRLPFDGVIIHWDFAKRTMEKF